MVLPSVPNRSVNAQCVALAGFRLPPPLLRNVLRTPLQCLPRLAIENSLRGSVLLGKKEKIISPQKKLSSQTSPLPEPVEGALCAERCFDSGHVKADLRHSVPDPESVKVKKNQLLPHA